ncbi:hypothetical protein ES332_A09G118700v1 [Gossypium tomentosum]|uniref:Bystin n=1 Tax=Gossypium tomentosum TaxID=34277 RepID=A0A5D2P682_GOSTO|nr:hypothetical protein ES332_A09G118700v1 [Gossypium tomentosum]
MVKNKRERNRNSQPFLADGDSVASSKKRSKAPKHHQKQDKMLSTGISSKFLKEALLQQKEIEDEASGGNVRNAFGSVKEEHNKHEEEEEEEEDIDNFDDPYAGKMGDFDEIDEEDEKLLEAFLSKDAGPQRTLADIIIQKIKENDGNVASAFKHIPSMQLWEDVLYLTEPEQWSPNAMFQATRIFASNLGAKKAERFYRLVLLRCIRDDVQKNKRLHFALYQSLKKALYKPAAFNKGILFPLCKSETCNLREVVIVGSVLQKVSIPMLHSSVALMKLVEMEYCGTTSYFIKLLLEKKYALPYRVVDAVVDHFMRFLEDTRIMPAIWHHSLLAFVQRYKNKLRKEDKNNLRILLDTQKHKLVTPEIIRELDNSCNRGEKEGDLMNFLTSFCSFDEVLLIIYELLVFS